jgi:hypothetical protein
MEAQPAIKQSLFPALLAFFCFFVVGFIASSPLEVVGGGAAGFFKGVFFTFAFIRLAWSIYKRTFRWLDYFIYFALVIGFCVFVESRF